MQPILSSAALPDASLDELGCGTNVLESTASSLAHVRMLGARPETQGEAPGTLGTGALMSRLALQGYGGTIACAPSGAGHEEAWHVRLTKDADASEAD